jgi:hypothetical protein
MVGVNSSSNFNRLQGIPCCLRKRRILKQFQQLAGDSLLFAEQGIVSSEQGISQANREFQAGAVDCHDRFRQR